MSYLSREITRFWGQKEISFWPGEEQVLLPDTLESRVIQEAPMEVKLEVFFGRRTHIIWQPTPSSDCYSTHIQQVNTDRHPGKLLTYWDPNSRQMNTGEW